MIERKPSIKEAIIVEGRYDKNTVSQIVDALIVSVNGFNLFNNPETRNYILDLAKKQGIIILTDSDSAGFMIRRRIRDFVPVDLIKDAYIPDIFGKEKRKDAPGKEGKLGVEGMSREVILHSLKSAGATFISEDTSESRMNSEILSAADLYSTGFSGKKESARMRSLLLKELGLPEHLNTNDLLRILSGTVSKSALYQYAEKFNRKENSDDASGIRGDVS
ncbi:MAG: DUF4093 domain-containing protein [Eubacteriales bacterium]|nr:DUF4093 domain-containing protein [Eubacteriales bacterium]